MFARRRASPAVAVDALVTPAGQVPGKAAREGTAGPSSEQGACSTTGAAAPRAGIRSAAGGGVRKAIRLPTPTATPERCVSGSRTVGRRASMLIAAVVEDSNA